MSVRPHLLKIIALAAFAVVAAWLLFAWLALPRIVDAEARQFVQERTGHRLTFDPPRFNPFTLDLRLGHVRLDEPDGGPLFELRELSLNLSFASLFRRALVFDAIRLDGPHATLVLRQDGSSNWSALVRALGGGGAPAVSHAEPALPRLAIHQLVVSGGAVYFADQRKNFATRISPLAFELEDISTLPGDRDHYRIAAQVPMGARMLWQGETTLNPLGVSGSLAVENVDLVRFAPYLREVLPVAPPSGVAGLAVDYHLSYTGGHLDLALENLQLKLMNFGLTGPGRAGPELTVKTIDARNGRFDLANKTFTLGSLTIFGSRVTLPRANAPAAELLDLGILMAAYVHGDLGARKLLVGRVLLRDGVLQATRDAAGRIDLVTALRGWLPPERPAPAEGAQRTALPPEEEITPAPWHYRLNKFELENFSAILRDETVAPAARLALQDITLTADAISDELSTPVPVRASFTAEEGGRMDAVGSVVPGAPSADFHVRVADLALKPAQPYLAQVARLILAAGSFSTEGRASYGKRGVRYQGGFAVRKLSVLEAETRAPFLTWQSVATQSLEANAHVLNIGRLDVARFYTRLIINADKSVNLKHILRTEAPADPLRVAAASAAESAPLASPPFASAPLATEAAPAKAREAPAYLVNVDRVRVSDSEMDYADYSLILPFETHIRRLRGFVNGLSSMPGAPGQIELDGQVDDYGVARAVGQIELFDPTDFTDVKVMFDNVEMTRLSPYSTTFAGRRIDSGKLTLNLKYEIKQQQLAGDNEIVIDRLTLGERVKSPQALDLPLDLAIAILEDSDHRIDLGLPVSGSLGDPEFSYGGIVWKAVVNLFKMIATAPFRALINLFGGGVKLDNVYFDPGGTEIKPPERENILHLAGVFNKRPRLFVTVHGTWSEADRVALQDLQLRRKVAKKAGIEVGSGEDPGPLSTRQPKVQAAIETLFADAFGRGELASLKDGYRRANPGQMEEGLMGRMMSRLATLFSTTRTLEESEVEQLKGADFHAVLFARLRAKEDVPELALQSLATARGDATYAAFKAAQAPLERLALGAPEKEESDAKGVPIKLELGTAPKTAAALAAAHAS